MKCGFLSFVFRIETVMILTELLVTPTRALQCPTDQIHSVEVSKCQGRLMCSTTKTLKGLVFRHDSQISSACHVLLNVSSGSSVGGASGGVRVILGELMNVTQDVACSHSSLIGKDNAKQSDCLTAPYRSYHYFVEVPHGKFVLAVVYRQPTGNRTLFYQETSFFSLCRDETLLVNASSYGITPYGTKLGGCYDRILAPDGYAVRVTLVDLQLRHGLLASGHCLCYETFAPVRREFCDIHLNSPRTYSDVTIHIEEDRFGVRCSVVMYFEVVKRLSSEIGDVPDGFVPDSTIYDPALYLSLIITGSCVALFLLVCQTVCLFVYRPAMARRKSAPARKQPLAKTPQHRVTGLVQGRSADRDERTRVDIATAEAEAAVAGRLTSTPFGRANLIGRIGAAFSRAPWRPQQQVMMHAPATVAESDFAYPIDARDQRLVYVTAREQPAGVGLYSAY